MFDRRRRQFLPGIFLCLPILGCVIRKFSLTNGLVYASIQDSSGSQFGYLAVKHDLAIFVFAFACYWIAAEIAWVHASRVLRLILVASLLPYVADIAVLSLFHRRLESSDVAKFAGERAAVVDFLAEMHSGGLWIPVLLALASLALIIPFLFVTVSPPTKRMRIGWFIVFAAMSGLYWTNESASYVHAWTYENVYEVNARQGISVPYSAAYIEAVLTQGESPLEKRRRCTAGLAQTPNIIILLVESLSMYHSELFSGLPTTCPQFDRIARENTAYTRFSSNGFTTEAALVSLMTGRHLFPPVDEYRGGGWDFSFAYQGFYGGRDTLPAMFSSNGYFPAFMTSGDLSFLDKDKWLASIGFEHIEGAETPFYDGQPRFHFGAAPDSALYGRAQEFLSTLQNKSPYALVIETVSTHQPFVSPIDQSRSEEAAFRYADQALGEFYDALSASGYFEHGILVILGDHRAMTPIRREETDRFGRAAASLVPMVIVWNGTRVPAEIGTRAQAADFIASFEYLVGKETCARPLHGNFMAEPPVPPELILFLRGDDRDIIDVYSGTTQTTIRIAGDATTIEAGEIPYADALLPYIAKERLRITKEGITEAE